MIAKIRCINCGKAISKPDTWTVLPMNGSHWSNWDHLVKNCKECCIAFWEERVKFKMLMERRVIASSLDKLQAETEPH